MEEKNIDISSIIDSTAEKNKSYNSLDKELKAEKDNIKSTFETLGISELSGKKYTAVVSTNVKETLNEERTLLALKEAGIDWLVHTKEYFDEAELEQSIMTGELDASILTDCTDTKETKVLKFKKVAKGKK